MMCARLACREKSYHLCFLHFEIIISIPTCCGCRDEIQRRCDTVNESLYQIRKEIPTPTTIWKDDDDIEIALPSYLKLIIQYLLEILGQLEMSISSQFTEQQYITEAYDAVEKNLKRLSCQL